MFSLNRNECFKLQHFAVLKIFKFLAFLATAICLPIDLSHTYECKKKSHLLFKLFNNPVIKGNL